MKIEYAAGIINSCIFKEDAFKESVYNHSMSDVLDGLYDAVKYKKLDALIAALVAFESIVLTDGAVKRRNGKTYLPFEKAAEYKHSASFKKIMLLTEEVAALIRERENMGQQIGIELEDSKYYIVWVAPNPDFPEEKVNGLPELTKYMEAVNICDQLNRDTKGTKGVYQVRKEVA